MKSHSPLQGFTLLATLFILIILSLAGIILLKIGVTQLHTASLTVLSIQARLAAQSAVALATQKWVINPQNCPAAQFRFGADSGMAGFDVQVECQNLIAFPPQRPNVYAVNLRAIATKGKYGERDFVSQEIERWEFLPSTAERAAG